MTTKQRSTSVSPFEIEMWDGPKTVVVKNPEGKIAYCVYGDENQLKAGYYAAQENPALFFNNSMAHTEVRTEYFPEQRVGIAMSRAEVEEILANLKHTHSWKKDDTCRCGFSKE